MFIITATIVFEPGYSQKLILISMRNIAGRFLFLGQREKLLKEMHLLVDTARKLNVHKTFRRCPARPKRLMCVQFTSCVYGAVNNFLKLILKALDSGAERYAEYA